MHMTAEQLRPQFEPFGNVEEVTIIYDKSTHLSKGERPSTPPLNATRRQFAMQTCDLRSSQIPSAPLLRLPALACLGAISPCS